MKFTIGLIALLPIALAAPAVSNPRDTDATITVDVLASIEPTDLDVLKARDGDTAPIGDILINIEPELDVLKARDGDTAPIGDILINIEPELDVLKSRDGPVEVLGDNVVGDINKSIGAKLDVPPVKRELPLQELLAEAEKKLDEAREKFLKNPTAEALKEVYSLQNEVTLLTNELGLDN